LMDIRVVIRQSTVIVSTLLSILIMFLAVMWLCDYLVDLNINYALLTIITLIFIITVSFFIPIKKFFERISNKYFFASLYNQEQILQNLIKEIPGVLDIKHLINLIVDETKNALQIERMGLLSTNLKNKKFVSLKLINYKKYEIFNLAKNKILIYYFVNNNIPVTLQKIKEAIDKEKNIKYKNKFLNIIKEMEENKIEIILPLISKKKLIGLLFLGNKIDNAFYSIQDINILKIIANQSAAALENALLYEETQSFNIKMRAEIKRATTGLRQANKELKKLDKVKSEFISIASHQLRTPITIIKGYISMLLEGDYGKINEKANSTLKQTYKSTEHMAKLVEDFLNISRIESGKIVFDFKKEKFDIIVNETADSFKEIAKTKNLKINTNIQKNLPAILVDKVKIKEVVSNLIDNAIKYTKQGNIIVDLKLVKNEDKKFLLLSITDNGMGIAEEDISNIFKKFIRGKKVSLVHTEGLGLGLYFSKKVIEAHHGKIWVESSGVEKGSVFYVKLLAKK
ncbi:MAG: GAF domain-containing sensor histidine kinase, partial [Patescibacteria group bacterium]|nr:GAF domain-containing sensor histidine kinase [Patescibacteria group bacterium]